MEIHDTHYGSAQHFRCEDLNKDMWFIIVFDMSSDTYSYQTKLWHDQIRKATKPNSSIVFIGNKSDKEDAIPCSKTNTILEHDYFVASARTSQGVDVAFGRLFDMVSGATLVEDTVSEALRNLSLAR